MRPLVPSPGGVALAWRPSPFGKEAFRADFPDDLSIAEILIRIDALPDRFFTHGVVFAHAEDNGQGFSMEVPRALWSSPHWHSIVPVSDRATISLTLHLAPAGGRSGGGGGQSKSTFSIVASIALVAATAAITGGAGGLLTGGALFAAGSVSASVLAAGVGIIGSLAIAALSAPPQLGNKDQRRGEDLGSAAASGNVLERAGVIPRVVGTFRAFPQFAASPIVEIVGKNEYVEAVYAMNGPHKWEDVKVDKIAIETLSDEIEFETREGFDDDEALTLVTRYGHTDAVPMELDEHDYDPTTSGAELKDQTTPANSLPEWRTKTTRRLMDEVWEHLLFPSGINRNDDPGGAYLMPLRVRLRPQGTTDWINCPEVVISGVGSTPLKFAVKFMWQDDIVGDRPTPSAWVGPAFALKVVPTQNVDPIGTGGWTSHHHFTAGSGDDVYNASTVSTTKVINTALYSDRIEFYLNENNPDPAWTGGLLFPRDVPYEIQFQRGYIVALATFVSGPYTSDGAVLDLFGYRTLTGIHYGGPGPTLGHSSVTIIRNMSIRNESPVGGTGLALLAVKAKNRSLANISALLSGYVPDWDGSTWSGWNVTSNPAPHFRYILAGAQTADPLPEALVDDDSLVDWRDRCDEDGLECNMVADGQNIDELLNAVCGDGYGRLVRSETWGVSQDRDRSADSPVQIFSPRTMSNFRWTKELARLPHGLRLRYRSKPLDYEEAEELIVYREGYDSTNATLLEAAEYAGLVTEAENQARAEFDLAQSEARSIFYSGECDAEAIVARRGDLIGVQHDIITHQAGFGRILEKLFTGGGLVSGIVLDSKVPTNLGDDFFSGGEFFEDASDWADDFFAADVGSTGAAIRLKDGSGTILVKEIDAGVEETETLMFVTPFADPGDDLLGEGCHVVSGPFGSEYRRLIISDMKPGPDLTWQVAMVDEAPELFETGLRLTDSDGAFLVDTDGNYLTDTA